MPLAPPSPLSFPAPEVHRLWRMLVRHRRVFAPSLAMNTAVVLATFGSLGDLHPFVALAHALRHQGLSPVIATSALYRDRLAAQGLAFHPTPPDLADFTAADPDFAARAVDPRTSVEFIVRQLFLPTLRPQFAALDALVADLKSTHRQVALVSHPGCFAAPLVAQRHQLPWFPVALSPFTLFSSFDPPVLPNAPWLRHLRPLAPLPFWLLRPTLVSQLATWTAPVRQFAAELGMTKPYAPTLHVGLFSRHFAPRAPDWPTPMGVFGFPFHPAETPLLPELQRFLDDGPAPVVFTLGSLAVKSAGRFFDWAVELSRGAGVRAVLLTDSDEPPGLVAPGVFALGYAPYELLFPRACGVVHQGGIGTTAQTLRAGLPALIVASCNDQLDNGFRAERLGVARVVLRDQFALDSPRNSAATRQIFGRWLLDVGIARRAAAVGNLIRQENAARDASDAIKQMLAGVPTTAISSR